ncbi:MAG: hypothetical protein FWE69_08525 [Clostridiales bacterium]|nr:hypothetical protein [Clostridiales bacterium]
MSKEYEGSSYRNNSSEEASRFNHGEQSKQNKQKNALRQAGSNNLNKYRF